MSVYSGEPRPSFDLQAGCCEVLVETPDRTTERRLAEQLHSEGFAVYQGLLETRILVPSNRRIAVPFPDRSSAESLAERLRVEAPVGSKVTVTAISAFRAWLMRHEFFGSYAT
jgi:hypothetical protein